REEPRSRQRLLDLQYQLLKNGKFSVVILVNGVDGAGKGETVNLFNEWMDPRHIRTHAFGALTDVERDRPEMWRFWQDLPEAPHLRTIALDVGESAEGVGADVARIHPLVEEVDRLALAGAVDAVHEDHHGKGAFVQQAILQVEEPLARLALLALELALLELVADLGGFEHSFLPGLEARAGG